MAKTQENCGFPGVTPGHVCLGTANPGKTCAKNAIAFWDYLGSRLNVTGQALVPYLPDLIRCHGQPG